MTTVQFQLPDSLQRQMRTLAASDGVSVDQFIATAVAEKIAAMMTESYLEERAKRGSRAKYDAALAMVPDVEPEPYDRLPEP